MSLHRRILLSSESNGHYISPLPSQTRQVPSNVIIAVASAAAACLFLALSYYAVLRHRRRRPPPSGNLNSGHDTSAASSDSDHPIWYIKTVGLDDSTIESIGSYAHRGGDRNADCPVCLGEVLDGETVRLLPKCSHVFHVQCIDTWLRSHVTCPLCRSGVVEAADDAAVADVDGVLVQDPQLEQEEEEMETETRVRVSVEIPESSRALGSASMDAAVTEGFTFRVDEEKEGNSSNCPKEEGLEKGQNESGRGFLFSRLGRARSSSLLPL